MKNDSYDVIIVGAGPSGAQCARTLAGAGAKVLVLDKKKPGWHKPCGGGVSVMALGNFEIPTTLGFETAGVRIFDRVGDVSVGPLPFYDLRRNVLDEYLANDAATRGAEVQLETIVHDVRRSERGHFEVVTREDIFRSRYLVGADGVSSLVRERLFSEKFDMANTAIALEYWFEWDHGIRHLDFYVEPEWLPLGYAYAFPKDAGTIAVGIAGLRIERPRELLDQLLELPRYRALVGSNPRTMTHGARIPYQHLPHLHEGRLLLVGDAAGLNTPIAFAGIPIALVSGRIAGNALVDAIRSGNDEALDVYSVEAIAGASFAFRGCHAYWRYLCQHEKAPSFSEFFAEAGSDPNLHMVLYLTWDMLNKLSSGLDLSRLRGDHRERNQFEP